MVYTKSFGILSALAGVFLGLCFLIPATLLHAQVGTLNCPSGTVPDEVNRVCKDFSGNSVAPITAGAPVTVCPSGSLKDPLTGNCKDVAGNNVSPLTGNSGGVDAGGGGVNAGGGGVVVPRTKNIINPLQSQTIPEFILKIIDVLLVFALPLIILYIMYAGFKLVTANGNAEQISSGRTALLWAVVGGVIVLGARAIIALIQGTIQAF